MNRPIRVLSVFCLMLFLALMLNSTYVQYVQAEDLNDRQDNRRVLNEEFSRERGPIIVDGEAIAESVPIDSQFRFQRQYTEPELYAKITGYFTFDQGRRALENAQNSILSGSDNRLFVNRVVDLIANNQPRGGSIELTIDPIAQVAAASALEDLPDGSRAAVVAIEPDTGAVLAMVDIPSYDPNVIATHDFAAAREAYAALESDPDQPMLNRSTQVRLPPGSTFKMVTAAAAIEEQGLTADSLVLGGSELSFPGVRDPLRNQGGASCGGDEVTLRFAMENSCNVSFGDLAMEVGQEALESQAEALGFGSTPSLGMAANESTVAGGEELNESQLAYTGIGQFNVSATPLQMAMVTAAIANDGDLMTPYLVETVRAPNLSVLDEAEPQRMSEAMSESTASVLTDILVSTVTDGTGRNAQIPGVDVAGKTGTAQTGGDRGNIVWFTSFAPADDPQVAVAVVVEPPPGTSDVSGGALAAPVARSVMEAVLNQ